MIMVPMHFVRATAAFDQLIAASEEETGAISYGRPLTPLEREQLQERRRMAFDDRRSHIFVLRHGEEHLGYYWLDERPLQVAFLIDFYVNASWRRKGIGRKILSHAIAYARTLGSRQIRLAVADANIGAKNLFISAGLARFAQELREQRVWPELRLNLL
jgi:GNAT superfamily N-acetyltransferase